MKRKSGILFLLYLLFSLLVGCAYQTYEELDAEARVTGDTTKLDKREALAERAGAFFAGKRTCLATQGLTWFCPSGPESKPSTKAEPGVDELIRQYGRARASLCGCSTTADVNQAMRELLRRNRGT